VEKKRKKKERIPTQREREREREILVDIRWFQATFGRMKSAERRRTRRKRTGGKNGAIDGSSHIQPRTHTGNAAFPF
jgi:hypothetical protein